MIAITAEFVVFFSVYTLIMITVGQFGGFATKQRIIGSSLSMFGIYIFTLALLLLVSVVVEVPKIINESGV